MKRLFTITFWVVVSISLNGQVNYEKEFTSMFQGEWKLFSVKDTVNHRGGIFNAAIVSNGRAIYSSYKVGFYEANGLWTYDREEGCFVCFKTNSAGEILIHKGNFDNNGILVLNRYSRNDKSLLLQKTSMEFKNKNLLLITIDALEENGKMSENQFYFKK